MRRVDQPVAVRPLQVKTWVGAKSSLLVMNRIDMVSKKDRRAWSDYYKSIKQPVYWTDAKQGDGVNKLKNAIIKAGSQVNEKRAKRGLKPRSVRACAIGLPNIGKSALINRLLNRRVSPTFKLPTNPIIWRAQLNIYPYKYCNHASLA